MNNADSIDGLCRVLLIEDDAHDAELVRKHLKATTTFRFQLEAMDNLGEACSKLTEHEYDAVLLDLNLPDSRGLDSVDHVRSIWTTGPIIVLTDLDEDCLGMDAIRHGVQDFLCKDGLTGRLLARTIRYALERHEMMYWLKASRLSKDQMMVDFCETLGEPLSKLQHVLGNLNSIPGQHLLAENLTETAKRHAEELRQLINEVATVPATARA
jgi:DNA-binding response OmpR family regulator